MTTPQVTTLDINPLASGNPKTIKTELDNAEIKIVYKLKSDKKPAKKKTASKDQSVQETAAHKAKAKVNRPKKTPGPKFMWLPRNVGRPAKARPST